MRDPDATKNLLVSKAISLFNTQGYRATSLSDITKAAGVSKGAIYGNFENKDALAVASFDHAMTIVMEDLGKRIRQSPTAPEKLKTILAYYAEYIKNPPIPGGCPAINTSIEADDNYPMLRSKVIRFIAMLKDSLKKIINRGITEGQMKPGINVDELALLIYTSINGAIMISRVEGDIETYNIIRSTLEKQIDEVSV